MTTQLPTRYTTPPATIQPTPVQYLDFTGVQEDVMWAVGRAQRLGQLVRMEPVTPNDDGTVTARIYHTGPAYTLAMPIQLGADVETANRWDAWDYFSATMITARYLFIGSVTVTALWGIWWVVTTIGDFLNVYAGLIVGGICVVLILRLLMALLGGRGCPGVVSHCFGCRS